MIAALAGAAPAWWLLGLALHLSNQVARGRGWWAIVRAADPSSTQLRRRDAVAAWIAGAGAAGVLMSQIGDTLRVWLLSRRTPDAGYPLLAGTLAAEAAGDLLAGLPLLAFALAAGVGPSVAPTWTTALELLGTAVVVGAAVFALGRSARGRRVVARLWAGFAPLAAPRAYARAVAPWQLASRACRLASLGCFLAAFQLPVTPRTVLVVMFAQATGRLVPFAPAALGAAVAVLAATFGTAAHAAVSTGRLAAFLVGTTTLLTLVGAVAATLIVLRSTDWQVLVRFARRRGGARAPWANAMPTPCPAPAEPSSQG